MLAEDLTRGVLERGEGGRRKGKRWDMGCVLGAAEKNPERNSWKLRDLSLVVATPAGGVVAPCFSQARVQLRLLGLEREVEGLHLQVAVAAAAVEGDTCR